MILNPMLLPKIRSAALMGACADMPCTLRVSSFVPSWSCAHQSTVVGCHLPVIGKGVATKVSDLFVAAGCAHCHDIVDARDKKGHDFIVDRYPAAYADRLLQALCETQARWVAAGLVIVPNSEVVK